jgi:hypothetical protein
MGLSGNVESSVKTITLSSWILMEIKVISFNKDKSVNSVMN